MTFNMYQLNQFLTNSKNITRKNCNIYIYIYIYIYILHINNTCIQHKKMVFTESWNFSDQRTSLILRFLFFYHSFCHIYIYIYIYIIYYMYITKKQKISILTITNDDNNLHSNACRKLCRINCPHSVLLSFVPKKSSGVLKESVVMFLFPFLIYITIACWSTLWCNPRIFKSEW